MMQLDIFVLISYFYKHGYKQRRSWHEITTPSHTLFKCFNAFWLYILPESLGRCSLFSRGL